MKSISKYLAVVVIVLVVATSASAALATQAKTDKTTDKTFQGTLSKVDADTHMVTAKGTDGKEMVFMYNDDTKVIGPAKDVEGLIGKPGANLRITYRTEGESNTASRIEVLP